MSEDDDGRAPRRRRVLWIVFGLLMATVGVVVAVFLVHLVFGRHDSELDDVLAHRGRIAWVGRRVLRDIEGTSVTHVARTSPLGLALASRDPSVAARATDAAGLQVLVIETAPNRAAPAGSFLERFAHFGIVEGFRTLYLREDLVVVERFELPRTTDAERSALARTARLILGGSIPPRLSQFPVSLRSPFSTEVLVLVRRSGGDLALWRSARSSSLASGVLTASGVARQRWEAREDTVGGAIPDSLPRVAVEVALLVEDGTFATHDPGFIDRAMDREHGVAYDDPSVWRYLLPESAERRDAAHGSDAFRALFRDNQIRGNGFERIGLRLYRVRVVPLASSPATD